VSDAFIQKLNGHGVLSDEDILLLKEACGRPQTVPARADLIKEGDRPGPLFVLLDGWACRYKLLPEGTRHITAILMPGDVCGLHASVLERMEHTVATLTPAIVAMIPRQRLEDLIDSRAAIASSFLWTQLVDEDTLRAWLVSMGRRDSLKRVAHLMCEMYVRARNVNLAIEGRLELPLTQIVLGDALGLTSVHVNRVLRTLRMSAIMHLSAGSLIITDLERLVEVAGFDESYLHRRLRRAA
jgi:CRP-like cAMP-binding protein